MGLWGGGGGAGGRSLNAKAGGVLAEGFGFGS